MNPLQACLFCNYQNDAIGTILYENDFCQGIAIADEILIGRFIIIPRAHRVTVFDLAIEEWAATHTMMHEIKAYLNTTYKPDGYNVGWNTGRTAGQSIFHAHMHIIPRYEDEPLAGKGISYWIKQKENKRVINKK